MHFIRSMDFALKINTFCIFIYELSRDTYHNLPLFFQVYICNIL